MCSIKTVVFLQKSFHQLYPLLPRSLSAIFTCQFSNGMSKSVSKSSSFEKVLQSPFSMNDAHHFCRIPPTCRGKNVAASSSTASSKKSKGTSRSAPHGHGRGRKTKRKRQASRIPTAPSNSAIKKPHMSSSTSFSLHGTSFKTTPSSSTTLAKIESPDLRVVPHPSSAKQTTPTVSLLRALRQRHPHSQEDKSYVRSVSNTNPSVKPHPSLTSINSSTVSVSFSRTLSTQASSGVTPKRSSTMGRNPFHLRRNCSGPGPGPGPGTAAFSINELARGLRMAQFKNVVVMSGAGISTASGIPDFRTPGTGLYDNLKQYQIPEPTAIFDITFFVRNPRPFFTLAKELYPGKYPPNPAHYFIRLLQDKGLLLRHYTQNIDGLERLAGIVPGKLVESHGSFATASCTVCQSKHDPQVTKEIIFHNKIPHCKHKLCKGIVKPDIVFFGEDLPYRFHALRYTDLSQCDLLIVMGTSLEVEPFASLVSSTRYDVPRVLVNREIVGPFKSQRKRAKDINLTGEINDRINELARMIGWSEELNQLVSDGIDAYQSDGCGSGRGHTTGTGKTSRSFSTDAVSVSKSVSTTTATSYDVTDVTSNMSRLSVN